MRLIGLAVMLTIGLLVAPLTAEGQQAGKVYRISFLRHLACPEQLGLANLVCDRYLEMGAYSIRAFKVRH